MDKRFVRVLIAALVLSAAAVPVSAGTKGSKSESATAAWLADGSNRGCVDGNKPIYVDGSSISSDNFITGDVYVWVLSSSAVDTTEITWVAVTGNSGSTHSGDLDYLGSCGEYDFMFLDWHNDGDNEPDTDDGAPLQTALSGSWSFKFDYDSKNFSADSARFGS